MSLVNVARLDTFLMRDNADVALTGLTSGSFATVEAYDLANPATTATVTITEIGAGEYSTSFTPTTVSVWTVHLLYSSGGVFREFSQTYTDITAPVTTTTNIAVTGTTSTRGDLRRRVADQLGDYVALEATSDASSPSTIIDALTINQGAENFNGRQLIFTNGPDAGTVVRITGTSETTNTITFTPAVTTAPVAGTTADVVNERGRGWTVDEYHRAIRSAIRDAYPLGLSSVAYEYDPNDELPAPTFDVSTLRVATPSTLVEVHTVEWQDTSLEWRFIPHASNTYTPGWRGIPTTGQIEIRDFYGRWSTGMTLRVSGYARFEDNLATDSDATNLNEEWIVARACFHLCLQAVDRDSARGNLVLVYKQESERLLPRIRLVRKNGTQRIRGD